MISTDKPDFKVKTAPKTASHLKLIPIVAKAGGLQIYATLG